MDTDNLKPDFDFSAIQQNAENLIQQKADELEKYLVRATDEIPPPPIALKINDTIFGTLGNISMITGKAKSRKSFYLTILTACFVSDEPIYQNFENKLPEGKKNILFFDTEQSKYHISLSLKRICQLSGNSNPKNLKVYGLRPEKPENRLKLIEQAIYSQPELGFVFIDGIRDLVTSINDEEQATMITSKLMKWSEELNIHIVVVLHQNKSNENARGHLGTELINKCETVLSVSVSEGDKDISIVEPMYCRNKEPDVFAFEIIEGLPTPAENYEIRTETRNQKFDTADLSEWQLFEILQTTFNESKSDKLGYSELVRQVKFAYKKLHNKKLGDNRAKDIITLGKNAEYLLQDKEKQPYYLGKFDEADLPDFNTQISMNV